MEPVKLLTYETWCEQCERRNDSDLASDFWLARCVCGAQRADHVAGHPHLIWSDDTLFNGVSYTDDDVACSGFLELDLIPMVKQVAEELIEIRDGLA